MGMWRAGGALTRHGNPETLLSLLRRFVPFPPPPPPLFPSPPLIFFSPPFLSFPRFFSFLLLPYPFSPSLFPPFFFTILPHPPSKGWGHEKPPPASSPFAPKLCQGLGGGGVKKQQQGVGGGGRKKMGRKLNPPTSSPSPPQGSLYKPIPGGSSRPRGGVPLPQPPPYPHPFQGGATKSNDN